MTSKKVLSRILGSVLVCLIIASTFGTFPHVINAASFGIGDTVEVYNTGGVGLYVLDAPCGNVIGGKFDGERGVILDGPVFCVGYNRWEIRWDDGLIGWSAENWLKRVSSTPTADTINPVVNSLSVTPSSVIRGDSFAISYSVSDSGGSGLNRAELWRANDSGGSPVGWAEVKRTSASGNSYSGSFSDSPSSVGTYWYGIHAVDNAGNWAPESSPVKVTVIVTPELLPPPMLYSPSNGVGGVSTTPTFSWSSVSGANYYWLTVATNPSYLPTDPNATSAPNCVIGSNGVGISATFYQPSSPLSAGVTYYWKVQAYHGSDALHPDQQGNYSSQWSFTIGTTLTAPTQAPAHVSPYSGATDISLAPAFQWQAVSGATKYGFYISQPPYGEANLVYENEGVSGTSLTLPSGILDEGVRYCWNMRAGNSAGWGPFSSGWYFTTETETPELLPPPSLSSPSNGASGVSTTPTFSWSSVSGANKYWLVVATSPGALPTDPNATYCSGCVIDIYTTSTSHTPSTTLNNSTVYYWQVQAFNDSLSPIRQGQYSSQRSFTTGTTLTAPTSAPTHIAPYNGAGDISLRTTFQWGSVANADYYALYISEPPYGSDHLVFDSEEDYGPIYGTSFTLPSGVLSEGVTYRWNMSAWNEAGRGPFSQSWSFTTGTPLTAPTSAPVHVSPSNGVTDVSLTPIFQWSGVSGADYYELTIWNPATNIGVYKIEGVTGTSLTLPSGILSERVTYYWNMRAGNVSGWGPFSSDWYFATGPTLTVPTCWDTASLSNAELADLVIQHFPDGTVPQTGENIRVTAYAVARAESDGNPTACGDNDQSVGIWQIYLPSHPEYSKDWLFDPDNSAEAAREISNNGQDWNAWCTWEESACGGNGDESYKAYLDEARAALGIPTTPAAISARIDSYFANPMEVVVGSATTLSVTFTNTGNTTWIFYVAADLRTPNGAELYLPLKPVSLDPGEQGSASWTYTIDMEGEWDLIFGIWRESSQETSLAHSGWVRGYMQCMRSTSEPSLDSPSQESDDASQISQLRARIKRLLETQWIYPPYDPSGGSVIGFLALNKKYDEYYYAGADYARLATTALLNARKALDSGNIELAQKCIDKYNNYNKISFEYFQAAMDVYYGNLDNAESIVEGIKIVSEYTTIGLGAAIAGPSGAKAVSYLWTAVDFAVEWKTEGLDEATKNLIVRTIVSTAINWKWQELGGKSLVELTKNDIGKDVFPIIQSLPWDELVQLQLSNVIKELGVSAAEDIGLEISNAIMSMLEEIEVEIHSPGELRVYDAMGRVTGLVNGEARNEIPMSVYFNGTIIIYSSVESLSYEVVGTAEGTYGIEVSYVRDGEVNTLTRTNVGTSATTVHDYTIDWDALSQGEECVTVEIDSEGDGTFEESKIIQPPTASFTCSPVNPVTAEEIIFDASESYDADGAIVFYEWDFGDGTNSSGMVVTHTYSTVGDYSVSLSVVDNDGVLSTYSMSIQIKERQQGLPPWAWITIVLVGAFLIWARMPRKTGSRRHNSHIKKVGGEIKMAKKQTQITVPTITLSGKTAILAGVVVALLLLVIGAATGTEGVAYAGIFILPLTLFCGGLSLTEENTPIRVTLLVFGGLLLLAVTSAAVTSATILGMF